MVVRKGILFVISGPSGVGKGTVRSAVLEEIHDLIISVSVTTRPPRSGEKHGEDYFFICQQEFEQLIQNEQLLEWAHVYQNMYGTPREFVRSHLEKGQDILLEIDIQGALQVKERIPEGVFIFLMPPNIKELSKRLLARGKDTEESIGLRMAACEEEIAHVKHYDYVVVNDEVKNAVEKVRCIVIAERCNINNLNLR